MVSVVFGYFTLSDVVWLHFCLAQFITPLVRVKKNQKQKFVRLHPPPFIKKKLRPQFIKINEWSLVKHNKNHLIFISSSLLKIYTPCHRLTSHRSSFLSLFLLGFSLVSLLPTRLFTLRVPFFYGLLNSATQLAWLSLFQHSSRLFVFHFTMSSSEWWSLTITIATTTTFLFLLGINQLLFLLFLLSSSSLSRLHPVRFITGVYLSTRMCNTYASLT